MPEFGKDSERELSTVDPRLQVILRDAIKYIDFTVLKGFRGADEQNEAYRRGNSKVMWPNSKHNKRPSEGVDIVPYPIDWEDEERFFVLYCVVKYFADKRGIKIKCGVEWGWDLGHYQLEV